MSSPTFNKIAYGCLGAIAVVFVLLFAFLFAFPNDEEAPSAENGTEEPSLAEAAKDIYYEAWTKEVDGELVFDHPGGFGEEIPTVEWIDSENDYEIIVRVIEFEDPDFYYAVCEGVATGGYPGQLDGEEGRLDLRYVTVQDEDGNELESCDNMYMRGE